MRTGHIYLLQRGIASIDAISFVFINIYNYICTYIIYIITISDYGKKQVLKQFFSNAFVSQWIKILHVNQPVDSLSLYNVVTFCFSKTPNFPENVAVLWLCG